MKDFFVSYNSRDQLWAEWIAWNLEEGGYTTVIQAWDFKAGGNFVMEMQKAATEAQRTIAVMSQAYLDAKFTHPEWTAAFAQDPTGSKGILVPVVIGECDLKGLLSQIIYIDLRGLEQQQAKEKLLNQLKAERLKPVQKPSFPGQGEEPVTRSIPTRVSYPMVKVSVDRMPVTGSELFGREEELAFLDEAWQNDHTHVVTLTAWGGVGKTSLVNRWLNLMERDNYRGARRVFAWSFYSQGAAEGKQASADQFLLDSLEWFDDPEPGKGTTVEKGRRLAALIKKDPVLLILDGLEPLQYPPRDPGTEGMEGKLKDPGMAVFLKGLAASGPGLCVISSRLGVTDLANLKGFAVKMKALSHLSGAAGVRLLESLGVQGLEREILAAVGEYDGHALALSLLGRFVAAVYNGDIRQRDRIPRLTGERKQGGHAWRVMAAYEEWLGVSPERELLYILGLFDRPAGAGALDALLTAPPIPGVTDLLSGLSEEELAFVQTSLQEANLLSIVTPQTLDCHPLIREYFGRRLEENNPAGWQAAHKRLFVYYKNLPEKELPDSLAEMEPLFAAVAHGCRAGLYKDAKNDVYWNRISRGEKFFIFRELGAFGSYLSVLSNFFDKPWSRPAVGLDEADKAGILGWVAFGLRANGRLQEAIQPMKAGLEMNVKQKKRLYASINTCNLSELMLTLGEVILAVDYARQSVLHADYSGDKSMSVYSRTTLADALHLADSVKEAENLFLEAEEEQKKQQAEFPYLSGFANFRFCDLLLGKGAFNETMDRAQKALEWDTPSGRLLDIGLHNLTLGRTLLKLALQKESQEENKESDVNFVRAWELLDTAVAGLREYGDQTFLVKGLLARAEFCRHMKQYDEARADLNEALEIATSGGMKLFLVDYHLEKGHLERVLGKEKEAEFHFKIASQLIDETGYKIKRKEVPKVS